MDILGIMLLIYVAVELHDAFESDAYFFLVFEMYAFSWLLDIANIYY